MSGSSLSNADCLGVRGRATLPGLTLLCCVLFACGKPVPKAPANLQEAPTRPDVKAVLLVVLDGVRSERLGLYGNFREPMPALASLAQTGVVFEDALALSTGTNAAFATLFSGLAPIQHGLGSVHELGQQRLRESVETLAESLAGQGWRTLAITALPQLSNSFSGLLQGFEQVVEAPIGGESELTAQEVYYRAERALAPLLAPAERLFACVHFADARSREVPAAEWFAPALKAHLAGALAQRAELAPAVERLDRDPSGACAEIVRQLARARGSPLHEAYQAALHEAHLAQIDHFLARLLGLFALEHTLVVVCGTRGELYEQQLPAGMSSFPRELVRIPLVIAGAMTQNARVTGGVSGADVAPSVRARVGLPVLASDGSDRLTQVEDGTSAPAIRRVFSADFSRQALFATRCSLEPDSKGTPRFFLRTGGGELVLERLEPVLREECASLAEAWDGRLYGSIFGLERGTGQAEPLTVDWRIEDGYIARVEVEPPQPTTEAASRATRLDGTLVLGGPGRLLVSAHRRSANLRWRLRASAASLDESRIWIGNRPLAASFLPRLPALREEAWPNDAAGLPEPALVDFVHSGESWWRLDVGGESGRAVRMLLMRAPPSAAHEPLSASPRRGEVHAVPGRSDALWLEGHTPFEVHLQKKPSENLALAVAIDGQLVPVHQIRWRGRRFVPAGEINLLLPEWLAGVSDDLDSKPELGSELPPGDLRLWREGVSIAPAERSAATREELEFVRWLGASE